MEDWKEVENCEDETRGSIMRVQDTDTGSYTYRSGGKMNGCIASGPLQKRCWVVILGSTWSETNIRVTDLLKKKLCFVI